MKITLFGSLSGNEPLHAVYHTGGNPYFFSLYYRLVESDVLILFATNDWNTVLSGQMNDLIAAVETEYASTKQQQDSTIKKEDL